MIPHGHKILLSLALPWLQPSPVSTTATASTSEVCSNDSSGETSCSTAEKPSITSQECGIWLAPSSLEGAGLGMYAGKDYQEGEMIGPSGDVVIATVDIESHQFAYGPDYYLLWDEYFWNG